MLTRSIAIASSREFSMSGWLHRSAKVNLRDGFHWDCFLEQIWGILHCKLPM